MTARTGLRGTEPTVDVRERPSGVADATSAVADVTPDEIPTIEVPGGEAEGFVAGDMVDEAAREAAAESGAAGAAADADHAKGDAATLRRVFGSAAMLSVVVACGQMFGMARELFVASQVGASLGLDALLIALVAPTMLGSLISGGTTAAIVPAYARVSECDGREEARRLIGAVLGWTVVIALVCIVVIVALDNLIVTVAGPGLSPAGREFARAYLPIVAPIIAFTPLADLMSGICQIHGRFRLIAVAWFVGPVSSLAFTVAAWPSLGLYALAVGWCANIGAIFTAFLVVLAWNRLLPMPRFTAARRGAIDLIKHAAPLTLSSAVLQLNLLSDRGVASTLSAGSISAIRYGEGLVRAPVNAIAPAWNTAIYPSLVKANRKGATRTVGSEASLAVRYIVAVFAPMSLIGAALAPLAVNIAYRRGAFDAAAAHNTTLVVAALAPLLTFLVAKTVVTSAHNSYRHATLLFASGLLNAVVNFVLDVAFGTTMGAAGISLSTSCGSLINLLLLGWLLGRHDPNFRMRELITFGLRAVVAGAIVAVPVAIVSALVAGTQPFVVEVPAFFLLGAGGLLGYLWIASRIGLSEPGVVTGWVIGTVRKRVRR